MDKLQIAFVGLGSIGSRHLKNVYKYLSDCGLSFEISVFRSGMGKPISDELNSLITNVYYDGPRMINRRFDVVFITNPTSLHQKSLIEFCDYADTFFVEKPIFDSADVEPAFINCFSEKKVYVACPLRFNPVIQYVHDNIDMHKVFSARAISSSYLPDWRPGTDYRECYSAHEDMGGGVHLDLIHEWDYLTWFLGDVKQGYSIIEKVSKLEIDSKDAALYIAKTENSLVELHLDYYGRKARRQLTLYTPDETYECDIQEGFVKELRSGREIAFSYERNQYQMKEIEHFFDIFFNRAENDNTIEHAVNVLKYARGVF